MNINLTKQVIESLCRQSPELKLFFDTHFELIEKQSLSPKISKGKPTFPTKTVLVPKKLTFEEKLRYYEKDINKWNADNNHLKDYIIIHFGLMKKS